MMNSAVKCPEWEGFKGGEWQEEIDPAGFIRLNYTPYDGDESFLAKATDATTALWTKLQTREVAELFHLAHAEGVTTCLDTAAGCFDRNNSDIVALLGETDTVLLDIKQFDAAAHRDLTGADNAPVLDCARYLAELGKDVWIRRVLVPGVTDGEDDLRATGEFVRSLSNVRRAEILPYHAMGVAKWRALGLPYTLENAAAPSPAEIRRAGDLLGGPFCDR